jgi:hypothetical protein
MRNTSLKIAILIVFCTTALFAQEYNQDHRIWLAYTGQYQVSKHFGYHLEAQFRMDNELEFSKQNLFRIGAIYYLSPSKSITAGYGVITTYKPSLDDYYNENRAWQQYQYNHRWLKNRNTITHRFRLEQRWVEQLAQVDGNVITTGREYQNRLRYLNRNLFHLFTIKDTNNEVYALLQNELFVTLGENKINKNFIDQNRFLVGLGLNYNNHIRMELGYLNHYVTSSTAKDVMNHTVSIALIQNLDLTKH